MCSEVGTIGPDCCSVSQGEFENCDLASEDTATIVHTYLKSLLCLSGSGIVMFQPRMGGIRVYMCPRSYVYRRKEQDDSLFDYLMIYLGVTMDKY